MGVSGCVAYMFDNVSLFTFKGHTDEEVLETLMKRRIKIKCCSTFN